MRATAWLSEIVEVDALLDKGLRHPEKIISFYYTHG